MVTDKPPIQRICNFICECCNFKCGKNSEYIKHLLTAKHVGNASGNSKKSDIFTCKFCSKNYKSRKGLWGHNKTCNSILEDNIILDQSPSPPPVQEDVKNLTAMVIELMKSNTELQKQMLEVCKNTNNNSTNNIYNNSHNNNKTFNLQFFLNEQCKDAMNIMDFVNSVTLQLSDLESVGQLGYVEGITKIMIKKLTEMDIYKRPVHCSDAKREIIHIKDNDVWAKEEETYPKLRRAIKYISKKNSDLLLVWSAKYPESKNIYSKVNETYLIMLHQAMGGTGEVTENENKIIKKISKMILIDK